MTLLELYLIIAFAALILAACSTLIRGGSFLFRAVIALLWPIVFALGILLASLFIVGSALGLFDGRKKR